MRSPKRRIVFLSVSAVLIFGALALTFHFLSRTPIAIAYTTAFLHDLHRATTNFYSRTGHWPSTAAELATNKNRITFLIPPRPHGFLDGLKRPFIFEPFNTNRGYGRIISYGRDGKPGGTAADSDFEARFPD